MNAECPSGEKWGVKESSAFRLLSTKVVFPSVKAVIILKELSGRLHNCHPLSQHSKGSRLSR